MLARAKTTASVNDLALRCVWNREIVVGMDVGILHDGVAGNPIIFTDPGAKVDVAAAL